MLIEQIERQVLADRQGMLAGLLARGSEFKESDLPSLDEERARFNELLAAEPKPVESVDSEQHRLRVALGVA